MRVRYSGPSSHLSRDVDYEAIVVCDGSEQELVDQLHEWFDRIDLYWIGDADGIYVQTGEDEDEDHLTHVEAGQMVVSTDTSILVIDPSAFGEWVLPDDHRARMMA